MAAGRANAWVVIVPDEDSVECAILSGKMVRKSESTATAVALISCAVSNESQRSLNRAFDMVIVRDTKNGEDESIQTNMLRSSMTLKPFSRMIVLTPGTFPVGQADYLFTDLQLETGNFVEYQNYEDWRAVRLLDQGHHTVSNLECSEVTSLDNLDKNLYPGNELVYVNKVIAEQLLIQMGRYELGDIGKDLQIHEATISRNMVAIVGMACRFPQANSLEEYWDILENGRNTCSAPPDHRLSLVDMDPEIKANFLKCPIDQFDAGFFGISPSEAGFTDSQARLLLEVSWEAFENAGINSEGLRGSKAGVFYGSWLQEYKECLNDNMSPGQDFLRKYLGNGFGCTAAKLSYFYGFTGPNVSTESGCSSSMIAVDMAVNSLQRRKCPLALACGANLILHMTQQQRVWAADGKSKTFDSAADGYARAEGIAVLVLKRYEDAMRDGDMVHGIIRGTGSSQEGLSKSFGAPTVESEYSAMRDALRMAKVDPSQVDYVEAHATGTAVGDPIEAAAIVKAYSSEMKRSGPLWIGSGKTNMGHSESCSGLAGIIKVVMAMEHEAIPKHVNLTTLNPLVDFTSIPGAIPFESIAWSRRKSGPPRIAGVSSFGITGTDVHVIIQEPPECFQKKPKLSQVNDSPSAYLLTLSAKSESALNQMTDLFRNYLNSTSDSIEDITFTASVCRPHHIFRTAIIAQTKQEMVQKLKKCTIPANGLNPVSSDNKICFTFPGKIGTMDLSSFRSLYHTDSYFRNTLLECERIYKIMAGPEATLRTPFRSNDESANTEQSPEYYYLVISCQYAAAKLWMHWGIQPDVVLGHCYGELVALLICGAINLLDAYRILSIWPHFLQCQRNNPASCMALQADASCVQELINNFIKGFNSNSIWIDVTSTNSQHQTVVAGPPDVIANFEEFCKENGLRCKILAIEVCAHSRVIDSASHIALGIFNKVAFHPTQIPYFSSATGGEVKGSDLDGNHLYKIFRDCVKFTEACSKVDESICPAIYLEVGCAEALTRFTRDNIPNATCVATFPKNGNGILSSLAELYSLGVNVNWTNFYQDRKDHLQRVPLPHYPFQRKSYWFERKSKANIREGPSLEILHPLLGACIDTPKTTVFQNDYLSELSHESTKFIMDHLIGSNVIFPGVAFLEMILSAGKYSGAMSRELSSAIVKNFKIHAPLLLDRKSPPKTIQCVVEKEIGLISVLVCSNGNGASNWKLHATAEFVKSKENGENSEYLTPGLDMASHDPNGKDAGDMDSKYFYANCLNVGLEFGETFRSLKRVHRNVNGGIFTEVANVSDGNHDEFLLHPILIDAMIQTFMLQREPELQRLQVPVQIGKFTVFPRKTKQGQHNKCHVQCKAGSPLVYLYDSDGHCLSIMEDLELVTTSVKSVLTAAGFQNKAYEEKGGNSVGIYQVTWQRAKFYQIEATGNLITNDVEIQGKLADIEERLKQFNTFSDEERKLDIIVNRLCYLYVVKALFELGWTPEVGPSEALKMEWGIVSGLAPAFKHFLGYLEGPVEYDCVADVETEILEIIELPEIQTYGAVETIHECGTNLAGILKGTVNAHMILFGERNLADHFYKTSRLLEFLAHMETVFKELVSMDFPADGGHVLRILEVGAGTGAFPRMIIPVLKEMGIHYEYHFTDISPTLVNKAHELFSEDDRKHFNFKILNLEMDPLAQGFPPEYFDLVVAVDVLHATRDLNKTLCHISMVTKVGGRILLGETEKPVREADICFGILEGYWLFEDGIRKGHCTVNSKTWLDVLGGNGFRGDQLSLLFCGGQTSVISAKKTASHVVISDCQMTTPKDWIIFTYGESLAQKIKCSLESTCRRVSTVKLDAGLVGDALKSQISNNLDGVKRSLEGILVVMACVDPTDCRGVMEPFLLISQYLLRSKMKVLPRLCVVTKGSWQVFDQDELRDQVPLLGSVWGFMRNVRIELPGIMSKCLDLERGTPEVEAITGILSELWLDDKEPEVVYRDGVRLVRRLNEKLDDGVQELDIPVVEEFKVELPKSKVIHDLKFVEAKNEEINDLEENLIKVEVRCGSLNFKDVLAVMKPSDDFENTNEMGLDFSGVVVEVGKNVTRWKVGDAVFGAKWNMGSMRSHVKVDEKAVISIPEKLSFAEAVTLPVAFVTAWYCMVNVANLKERHTVLVHAASGGVGLAAIQIAKLLGLRVIGTAGSDNKRRFLRGQGVQHVFNSRTLDFEQDVLRITEGQGVDMVLNCLTGSGFKEASLNVCKDGGHFVEISKLDIWSVVEVKRRRSFVKYDIVDIPEVDRKVLRDIMNKLSGFLRSGVLGAIPHTAFPACRLVDAMEYIQKAKQMGKVVIRMPQHSGDQRKDLLFNDRSTYMITGGKGTIGFATCKWMISQGAKFVVLVGRNEPSDKVKQEMDNLKDKFGAVLICQEVDISDYEQVRTLISEIRRDNRLPPLRGIHHCAGILSDRMIANQDWNNFQEVFKAKVDGARNLHRCTAGMTLEHFVLHGSGAGTFGHAGQSNYVSANSFLDHLAQYRNSCNLPALSISWGKWREGLASDKEVEWLTPVTLEEGILALDRLMHNPVHNHGNAFAGIIEFSGLLSASPYYRSSLLEHVLHNSSDGNSHPVGAVNVPQDSLLERYKSFDDLAERKDVVRRFVVSVLCEVLGTADNEIREDVDFKTMGMDSLMSIEFTNKISAGLNGSMNEDGAAGKRTMQTIIDLEENGTVTKLTQLILTTLEASVS